MLEPAAERHDRAWPDAAAVGAGGERGHGLAGPAGHRSERPVLGIADQGDRATRRILRRHRDPGQRQAVDAQDRHVVSGVHGDRYGRERAGCRRLHRDVVLARDHVGVGDDDPAPDNPARPLDPQPARRALDADDARPGGVRPRGVRHGRVGGIERAVGDRRDDGQRVEARQRVEDGAGGTARRSAGRIVERWTFRRR